jgi:hypothetical protein
MTPNPIPSTHIDLVARGFLRGDIVPFFGAGVNLCGSSESWIPGQNTRPPDGRELTQHLAEMFGYPEPSIDLAKVSQFADTTAGRGPLFQELHVLFDHSYMPTSLHAFFAQLPQILRARGFPRSSDVARRRLTIVTTNYDDIMERAFTDAGEKFHVISYVSEKSVDRALFVHWPPDGEPTEIEGNSYSELDSDDHPVVLKIHGAVERLRQTNQNEPDYDSFVITEDHYIDYLSRGDVTESIPAVLKTQLTRTSFLFLGYALRDWNLRAFLRRIWRKQGSKNYPSWAVVKDCSYFESCYWPPHNVNVIKTDLDPYVRALQREIERQLNETP